MVSFPKLTPALVSQIIDEHLRTHPLPWLEREGIFSRELLQRRAPVSLLQRMYGGPVYLLLPVRLVPGGFPRPPLVKGRIFTRTDIKRLRYARRIQ